MANERVRVRVTRHFARNLDAIGDFLRVADAAFSFEHLLDDLFQQVIPALERFPDLGADFLNRRTGSREAARMVVMLRQRLGSEASLRELVRGDYLLLYARRERELFLLAIRHHRQLSFDFPEGWGD